MKLRWLAVPVLVLSACSSKGEDVSQRNDALTGGLWNDAPNADVFAITTYGFGDVPAGSACAAGDADYGLNLTTRKIVFYRCEGTPLRSVAYEGTLTDAQRDAFEAEVARATTAPVLACVTTTEPYIEVDAYAGLSLHSWSNRCSAEVAQVLGAGELLASARGVSANAVAVEPIRTIRADVGSSLWTEKTAALTISRAGHGETPAGSSCVPGSTLWKLDLTGNRDEPPWRVGHRACVEQADGHFANQWTWAYFERSELAAVVDALGRAKRVEGAACVPTADVVRVSVALYPNASAQDFVSAASSCAPSDAAFDPVEGTEDVLAALEALGVH